MLSGWAGNTLKFAADGKAEAGRLVLTNSAGRGVNIDEAGGRP
jgi:hypothetical protein